MSTTPTTLTSKIDWAQLLPIFELAANTTLTVLSTTGVAPIGSASLAVALESAINPLIASIASGNTKTSDVMAAYGAMIGVLNALKNQTGLPASVLSKVEEYIAGAQNGMSAYLMAQKGFDASLYTPVLPIVVPAAPAAIFPVTVK